MDIRLLDNGIMDLIIGNFNITSQLNDKIYIPKNLLFVFERIKFKI